MIENNLIEDTLFARSIFLGGVSGVVVQKNTVRRTDCGGIVVHHDLAAYPSAANQDIQILGNTVDSAIGPAAVGTGAIAAITIANNYISNAGRAGIWVATWTTGPFRATPSPATTCIRN